MYIQGAPARTGHLVAGSLLVDLAFVMLDPRAFSTMERMHPTSFLRSTLRVRIIEDICCSPSCSACRYTYRKIKGGHERFATSDPLAFIESEALTRPRITLQIRKRLREKIVNPQLETKLEPFGYSIVSCPTAKSSPFVAQWKNMFLVVEWDNNTKAKLDKPILYTEAPGS